MNKGSTCNSCGAPIFWVRTQKGKNIPMNTGVVRLANMDPSAIVGNQEGVFSSVGNIKNPEGDWYISHFATCPEHDQWRRK